MELNGVNSYYTGYASTASQTNKDNKTSGTASANNYSDTAAKWWYCKDIFRARRNC